MKHLALCGALAALLAALLAGCGAKTAASARPAGSRELKSTPPDSMHATAAITEQYTLEKVVQAENGGKVRLNIHLPRLESDSADAARINAEIAQLYEYDVQEYADCPEAADPESWDFCIEMNWERQLVRRLRQPCGQQQLRRYRCPLLRRLVLRFCQRKPADRHPDAAAHWCRPRCAGRGALPRREAPG